MKRSLTYLLLGALAVQSQAASIVTLGTLTLSAPVFTTTTAGDFNATSTPFVLTGGSLIVSSSTLNISRNLTLGAEGGILNVQGNQVVWNGSISGVGAIALLGATGGKLTLGGTNTYSGGTEIDATRLEISSPTAIGSGVVDVNGGATLAILQSGTYANSIGFNVGGGTFEVASGKTVSWTGAVLGNGNVLKTGNGVVSVSGSLTGFNGSLKVSAGSVAISSSTPVWTSTSGVGAVTIASGANLVLNMGGTFNLMNKVTADDKTASIFFNPQDSSSVLKLSTTVPKIFTSGALQTNVQLDITGKILIYANGRYYQPYDASLPVGTPVWLDAEGSTLSATQRSLGYREVAYKAYFLNSIAATTTYLTSGTQDANGNTIYNYGTTLQADKKTSSLVGYWVYKDLPIMEGVDGKAYITDGHHTTAGYLEGTGGDILPGKKHVVLGTIVTNPSTQLAANGTMWADFSNANDAYLYGTNGNVLALPTDPGYTGLTPIYPGVANPMPTTPSRSSTVAAATGGAVMTDDIYRSLTWGMVDGIVWTGSAFTVSSSGATQQSKIKGYSKTNSLSPLASQPDINFVEFYWADFLRNRIVWDDTATVLEGNQNLISAPLSFYVAVANGIALARSEMYKDQFGRSLVDYTDPRFSLNTNTWAGASLKNGLAAFGDTYNMYLTDDSFVNGDIIPSGAVGVTNNLTINTGTGMTISGALANFSSISINTGGTLNIDWNDSAVNTGTATAAIATQNKTLRIPVGTADVTFAGDNDFSKLTSLKIGAGALIFDTTAATSTQSIAADITGAGSLRKVGDGVLSLSGANTFSGGMTLAQGVLVLGRTSTFDTVGAVISSPIGTGQLLVGGSFGITLAFDENVVLKNDVTFTGTDTVTIQVDSNAVELGGDLTFNSTPVSLVGPSSSALTISGAYNTAAALSVNGMKLRVVNGALADTSSLTLSRNGALGAARSVSFDADGVPTESDDVTLNNTISITVSDEGRLSAGQGTLTIAGVVSGEGKLVITSESPLGVVELQGTNTLTGGISIEDGATLKFSADRNLGDVTNQVALVSGALWYGGSSPLSTDPLRSLLVADEGVLNAGSAALNWTGPILGQGNLTIGAVGTTGSVTLNTGSSAEFAGRVFVDGGSLIIGHASALAGATLELNKTLLSVGADGLGVYASGTVAFAGISSGTFGALAGNADLALPSGFNLTVGANGASSVYSGTLSGIGANLSKSGGGAFTLQGSNTFSGTTTVSGGVLVLGSRNALAQSLLVIPSSGASVSFAASETVLGGITGSGSLAMNSALKISVGNNNQSSTYAGMITGNGGVFEKIGTGILTLSGSSTFSGDTVLTGGSLTLSKYSLQNSTLKVGALASGLTLASGEAVLGGLSGSGALNLPSGSKLTIGGNNANTSYGGAMSSGAISLTKVGTGVSTFTGTSGVLTVSVQAGGLQLGASASLTGGSVTLANQSNIGLATAGTLDYQTIAFSLASGKADILFNGTGSAAKLILPGSLDSNIRVLSLGDGTVYKGSTSLISADTRQTLVAGDVIPTSRLDRVDLPSGAKVVLLSGAGTLDLARASVAQGAVVQVPTDGVYTLSAAPSANAINATVEVAGKLNVDFSTASATVGLTPLSGSGTVAFVGGSAKIPDSSSFAGKATLASGAVAELNGSLGNGSVGSVDVSTGGVLKVNTSSGTTAKIPALSGGGQVAMNNGSIVLGGDNTNFTGTIAVATGVQVTVKGNLPTGTINLQDATNPLKVDTSSGSITLPGKVTGSGALALSGSGTVTMTSTGSIGTSLLKIGATAGDKPVLDVSGLAGGALVLSSAQTLSGGGKLVGSAVTNGLFSPGNSPGTFTVGKAAGNTGGNLTINGTVLVEYGKTATGFVNDVVVVGGTLTFGPSATIVLSKYTDGATYLDFPVGSINLGNVFQAGSLAGTFPTVSMGSTGFLTSVNSSVNGGSLILAITKATYGSPFSGTLQSLGNYLSSGTSASALLPVFNLLDSSSSAEVLKGYLQSLTSPIYAEAQRISLRRTAALTDSLQNRLTERPEGGEGGWSAWSDTYGWAFHRNASEDLTSWNTNSFGEVIGVQHTTEGMTLGLFGATGHTSATFSTPGSSLKSDEFHGGVFAHIEAGTMFFDTSVLMGNSDQSASRDVSLAGLGGHATAKFQSREYAVHLRGGLRLGSVESLSFTPSFGIVLNGYRQDGVSESGAGALSVTTGEAKANGWQTRLGSQLSRAFQVSGKAGRLSASAFWVHDFERAQRGVDTRLSGFTDSSYNAQGSAIGADAFEVGVGASVGLSKRTSVSASGNWQIRDGSSQPGFNLGLNIKF